MLLKWLRSQSIASRLFISATFWSVAILLVAGIVLSAINRRASEQTFDERLGVYLRAIVADVATLGDDPTQTPGELSEPQFELPLSGWYWQITRLDGSNPDIKTSRSLFAARLPKLSDQGIPADVGGSRSGYATGPDGRPLRIVERVIDVGDDGRYLVQVAATTEEFEGSIFRFNLALAITFALLALALVGTTALQVRYGLRPLRLLQDGMGAIRRGEGERIEGSFPEDIAPLASELNLLIASNREVVERARTHVGNLAHALKTPLSVIFNEAGAEDSPLAEKVREQAEIMRDQVSYYLERARAAARSGAIGSSAEVRPVIDRLVRTFAKIYKEREIEVATTGLDGPRFRGEQQDLEEMIGNLIDNAAKWSNAKVLVTIEGRPPADGSRAFVVVSVDDDGRGLPAASRAYVIARGKRLDESKPGSGLGLSIVADLASIYGGALALDESPLGGLRARLSLPSV